ncbi:hypothetical protein [Pedobacter sp. Leaf194]|uniref:hypothetical protein n=1 Tax=Pedobacter sp. Leaf194 TaxID=1736297 RepID=UPI000702C3B5|nr:hypothetical protein [Pedobacter sp. Leaf194]KQS31610.1 hypothetical protein ASG14_17600 [Pedobacter sp. Leaf194]
MIVSSYLLLSINSGWGYIGVLLAPDFPLAMLSTFVIAMFLAFYIHVANEFLETRYPYRKYIYKRLISQILIGMAAPIGFELGLASIYFFIKNGGNLVSNHFFAIDFILVVTFIVLLNGFYVYALDVYKFKTKISFEHENEIAPVLEELGQLRKIHRVKMIKDVPVQLTETDLEQFGIEKGQIACLCKIDGVITIQYFDKTTATTKKSIKMNGKLVSATDYFQINAFCILHRALIFQAVPIPSRRIRLIIRHPFNHLVHERQRIVSQAKSGDFKIWF